jgi:hypothetical protein
VLIMTHTTEDTAARKRREDGAAEDSHARSLHDARDTALAVMKAALSVPAAGTRTTGDVVPFRKATPSPPPRPPVQQPLRPAATAFGAQLRKMRETDPAGFAKFLNAKIVERRLEGERLAGRDRDDIRKGARK